MEEGKYNLQSKFVDSKFVRKAATKNILKTLTQKPVDSISVWQCVHKDGNLVSQGVCLYRKATDDEAPKKLMLIQKFKVRADEIFVGDDLVSDVSLETKMK
jgi:hypothetical protein